MVSLVYILSTEDPTESETLNITTYYPAPYGGYVSLLTTNNTYLARDAGSVGIGTASPGYKLDVVGNALFTGNYLYVNSESAGRLRVGAAWGMPGLYSGDDGAKDLILGVPSGRKVYLGVSTGDAWIEGGTGNTYLKGNVGIGMVPSYKLDVAGDVRISGTLRGLCTWRWDDGSYAWHSCAGGEWIMGFNPQGWAQEGVCGGKIDVDQHNICSYGGTRAVPTNGWMLCCRIQ